MYNCRSKAWTIQWLQTSAVGAGLLLGWISISTPVMAESTAEALRKFGLVGTWSTDCGKSGDMEGYVRKTYTVPAFGAATVIAISGLPGSGSVKTVAEIESAIRVTDDKIKITSKITSQTYTHVDTPTTNMNIGTIFESVFSNIGNKIRTVDDRAIDSHTGGTKLIFVLDGIEHSGRASPEWERCLN